MSRENSFFLEKRFYLKIIVRWTGYLFRGKAIKQNLSKTCLYNSNLTFQRTSQYYYWISVCDSIFWCYTNNQLNTEFHLRGKSWSKVRNHIASMFLSSRPLFADKLDHRTGLGLCMQTCQILSSFCKIPDQPLVPKAAQAAGLAPRVGNIVSNKNSRPCHFAAKRTKLNALIKCVYVLQESLNVTKK